MSWRDRIARAMGGDAWTIGLAVAFVALYIFTLILRPAYGLEALAIASLPVAFAAAGQAIVVISGGIDLSIGSVIALTNAIAAVLLLNAPELSVPIVLLVLLIGVLIGLVNGTLVVISRVPDIVVTLSMLFVWAGAALLVLRTPGGDSVQWLDDLIDGGIVLDAVPRALVVLLVIVGLVWIPLRRSRLGLSLYAIGSNQLAAFRSGVNVARTKAISYAFTGFFAALGGLALTASTGIGQPVPGPYLLLERRGHRARRREPGRRPWRPARPDHRHLHPGLDPRRPALPRRGAGLLDRHPGRDHGRRRHARRLRDAAAEDRMTAGVATARDQSMVAVARAWMRDRPLVALFVLLAVLVLVLQIVQPGIVTPNWVSSTLRFAIPLAIIAACQTLTMLTGGIDLSVAVVASMAAYVMATNVSDVGWLGASLDRPAAGGRSSDW